jgi:glycosyltransferase 2 family protein
LATVATPYLGRWARVIAWTLATAVGVARVYVGAHLPLDVGGGAAFGVSVGMLANALFGTPAAFDAGDRLDTGIVPSRERR